MPHETLLEIPQGSDGSWLFTAKNETTGAIINLTGATISFRVESTVPIVLGIGTGITIVNALLGQFRVTLTDEQAQIRRQAYAYECRVTEASGDKTLVAWGQLLLQGPTSGTITEGTPLEEVLPGVLNVRDFGALGDGSDDTVAVQAAIDAAYGSATNLAGRIVWFPPSDLGYKLTSTINIKPYVTLLGGHPGMRRGTKVFDPSQDFGSLFVIAHTGIAFECEIFTTVQGFQIWYPNQVTTGTPIAHDWTFHSEEIGLTLRDIAAPNPYNFIWVKADGAQIENVAGWPLNVGIEVEGADIIRVKDVQFNWNAHPSVNVSLFNHVQANGTAFKVHGADAPIFHNVSCFGYDKGFWFSAPIAHIGGSAYLSNIILDNCNVCILVTDDGLIQGGLRATNVELIPLLHGVKFEDSTQGADPGDKPRAMFSNLSVFRGAPGFERAVWITAASHARVWWYGGDCRGQTSEAVLNQSPNAVIRMQGVEIPSGTRVTNSGGGNVVDADGF